MKRVSIFDDKGDEDLELYLDLLQAAFLMILHKEVAAREYDGVIQAVPEFRKAWKSNSFRNFVLRNIGISLLQEIERHLQHCSTCRELLKEKQQKDMDAVLDILDSSHPSTYVSPTPRLLIPPLVPPLVSQSSEEEQDFDRLVAEVYIPDGLLQEIHEATEGLNKFVAALAMLEEHLMEKLED